MAVEAKPVLGGCGRIRGAKATTATKIDEMVNEVADEINTYIKDTYLDGTEGTHETYVIEFSVKPIGV